MHDDDLKTPAFLDRKITPATPATKEERDAYAAKSAPPAEPIETPADADAAIAQALAADADAKKKAKASNRIGRLIEKKAAQEIPEKFRAWDVNRSRYYDTRKSNSAKKETVMTATAKKKMNGSPRQVVSRLKTDRKRKPATKGAAPAKKQTPKTAAPKTGTHRERLIQMLKRDNGASLAEMQKANPLNGKTPYATHSANVSMVKRAFKVERVGEGKGEHRRYKIVG